MVAVMVGVYPELAVAPDSHSGPGSPPAWAAKCVFATERGLAGRCSNRLAALVAVTPGVAVGLLIRLGALWFEAVVLQVG